MKMCIQNDLQYIIYYTNPHCVVKYFYKKRTKSGLLLDVHFDVLNETSEAYKEGRSLRNAAHSNGG